ncbi:helix-turn-helix domain-containing protein, partial [Streptococcus anginosus]|uniref:helix-turn-helix domain-containing protein n=1 Tax=Streptococcus anginosus TaxID=1328 RepID=UPI0021F838A5
MELNARVAKILSDRRDQLGLSLRQIEQKSGVNYMTVKRLLDGTREMRMDDFRAIASALGLSAWRVVQQAEQGT